MATYTIAVSLIITLLQYISGEPGDNQQNGNPNSPCYDINGLPLRCEPIFSNIAFGLPVEATNTCGETLVNDVTGFPYSSSKIRAFRTFYRQTGATGATRSRDYCDSNSRDPTKNHLPQKMVDRDASFNTTSWWQSITLYEYRERNLGSMVQASITLHLGKAYDIRYIRLKFHSPRPESAAIYKRTSEGDDWTPYQFYSASCRQTYNLPQNGLIDTPTRAICTDEYSAMIPLSGGDIPFGTLDNRPLSRQLDSSPILQEFNTATAIQIRLTRLNTFGDEVFQDRSVLQSYYYAISDISVGAICKCNGHANQCVRSSSVDGEGSIVCLCQHDTTGPDCGQCKRTHNNKAWSPANLTQANACEECQCNGRSELCYFNQTLYQETRSGGYCQGCRDFTAGPHCEVCQTNYYRSDIRDVCTACNCDEIGSESQQCDNNGQCRCKEGVTGDKCDRCEANYYDFGSYGCRPCGCVEAGSYENKPYCNSRNGQCSCKENVEGQDCGRCKPGFFNLDRENKFGCIACFCNGKTSQCSSALGYARDYIFSHFDKGDEGWTAVVDTGTEETSLAYNGITDVVKVTSDSREVVYFNAPSRFLGDQKYSYNQFLQFNLRIGEGQGQPSRKDLVLEGNGRSVSIHIFAQNNSEPGLRSQTYRFRLNEDPLYQWTPTLSALDFQRLLSSLTAIKIRGTYNTEGSGFLGSMTLESATNGQELGTLKSIERCVCPPQYIGQYCESCAPGYRRETPFGGRSSDCVPCQCNGHSQTCDAESGACICEHETMGHNCEKCKVGWYGNAVDGTPNDCTACPCPGQSACYEQLDMSVSCLNCPAGYSGDLCDMCEDGYYGELSTGDNCTMCDCSGNIDTNAVGNCNSTDGICLKCIYNTGGDHCELCLAGFYGNATASNKGDCRACDCNMYGTDPTQADVCEQVDGQCACLPYVTGRQCDQCEEGYYNLESATGCEACLCDPIGSNSTECDLQTGQCLCKPGIGGSRCDVCIADYFGFSGEGCNSCDCLDIGSAHGQCDDSGQCVCKDSSRITGMHCDTCHENKYNLTAGCLDCPACYNLVQDAVEDIRQGLENLTKTLDNINDNPNVADDEEFTNQLKALDREIDDLHDIADSLKRAGGPASDDLRAIDEELKALQEKVKVITAIIDESDNRYNSIDLRTLNNIINDFSDEVSLALEDFMEQSSELYSKISAALGKNGPQSESQNMTALAQQSTDIVSKQRNDSLEINEVATNANTVSNEAYQQALDIVKKPEELSEKLAELESRIAEASSLLSTVNETAQRALDKASMIYGEAIDSLNDAERTLVPEVDTSILSEESQAIHQLALDLKNQTEGLMEEYSSLLNDTVESLKIAEETFNKTYTEQEVTYELMAEVDAALDKARKAIQDNADMLNKARDQLKLLQEFDQTVRDHKEKALEALKRIPDIEELLEKADNETQRANEAIQGAKQAANDAKEIATRAQLTANEASRNVADILADAKEAKMDADRASNITDQHGADLSALEEKLNELEPKAEAEGALILEVLTEAEAAKRTATNSAELLVKAKSDVDMIIDSLDNLPELNTTELERLEQEMDRIEAEYNATNIDIQVQELKEFNTIQGNLANLHVNSLDQLRADVANLELILNAIPRPPLCFTKPVLENSAGTIKKRRRQRKLRKRLRH